MLALPNLKTKSRGMDSRCMSGVPIISRYSWVVVRWRDTKGFSTPTKPGLYSKYVNLIEMAKIEH